MYSKDVLGNSLSDDAEFDDLEDFDYVDEFISDNDYEYSHDFDDFDDLDDLYDDEEESEESEGDDDDLEDDMILGEEEIEVHLVCEECGHKWYDYVTEDEYENDFEIACPLCGCETVTRLD